MDSTAGDLRQAAQNIEVNEKEQAEHTLEHTSSSGKDIVGEKQELDTSSSGSSSHDDPALAKLDSKVIKVGEVKEGEEAYAHLPDHEKEIVKRQLNIPSLKPNFKTLYRYATRNDLLIIVISAFCAIAGGAVMPLMTVCSVTANGLWVSWLIHDHRLSSVNWLGYFRTSSQTPYPKTSSIANCQPILYISYI